MSGAKGAGTERLGRRKRFSLCRTEYFGRLGMVKVIFGSVAAFPCVSATAAALQITAYLLQRPSRRPQANC
jgi:hypothetical protein